MSDATALYAELVALTHTFLKQESPLKSALSTPELADFFHPIVCLKPHPPLQEMPTQSERITKPQFEPKLLHTAPHPIAIPPPPRKPPPTDSIESTLKKIAPDMRLSSSIPDDRIARKEARGQREGKVAILALNTSEDELLFLKKLAQAIHSSSTPTKILVGDRIEQENRWDLFFSTHTFDLILSSSHLHNFPRLMHYYAKNPANNRCFLHQIPLIPLAPPATYQESTEEKALLWKIICEILKGE